MDVLALIEGKMFYKLTAFRPLVCFSLEVAKETRYWMGSLLTGSIIRQYAWQQESLTAAAAVCPAVPPASTKMRAATSDVVIRYLTNGAQKSLFMQNFLYSITESYFSGRRENDGCPPAERKQRSNKRQANSIRHRASTAPTGYGRRGFKALR